jgi:glycosyltransferase involved in cell wall biosynthesis
LVVLEAMLAGVPVVSTPVGLAEEEPDLFRLLPRDPTGEDIAQALLADLADASGTAERVVHARQVVGEQATPERFGREWTAAICEAVRGASSLTLPSEARRGEGPNA